MKGSSRVQAASEECLSLSACGRSGCGAAGERRGATREARGGRDWSLCSCHVDTRLSSSHHLLPFKSAKNTVVPDLSLEIFRPFCAHGLLDARRRYMSLFLLRS